ncbi:hypothetical protein TRVL_06111 [Trypanosoma vivax]|uniref:EamA domain-containing protein n=1 Tax=Trypanosoma vivax (strain Y486) TaxID=1055687 RepID=G0U968_TRYVY|nr:hypothetical protein TRVL_06111 [Trypanosoma vivax]CCC54152.1 conserved hypothetical protein [Trypanosoma vivax Y486]
MTGRNMCSNPPSQVGGRHNYLPKAALAGLFGAASATLGKLAVTGSESDSFATAISPIMDLLGAPSSGSYWAAGVPVVFRIVLLGANAFCTAQMWRWYVKALSQGPTPVCQIVNTGMNFVASALLGFVVFQELVTLTWFGGALLVAVGLTLVVMDAEQRPR